MTTTNGDNFKYLKTTKYDDWKPLGVRVSGIGRRAPPRPHAASLALNGVAEGNSEGPLKDPEPSVDTRHCWAVRG